VTRALLGRVHRLWDAVWFAPGSARNLAAARILVGGQALWMLLSRDLAAHSGLPAVLWDSVPDPMRWRYLIFPGHPVAEQALQLLALVSLVAVILGLFTRVACLLAALLLYHLAPFETVLRQLPPTERGFDVSVLALVVLAFAPCADAWNVRLPRAPSADATPLWRYHWPLCAIQLFLAQVYLFAGYAKLYLVGPSWISAAAIRNLVLASDQIASGVPVHPLGLWIASSTALSVAVAIATMGMDLGFIVAVFWKRSRLVLVPLALAFHLGILLATTIYYLNWPLLLVFVDWDWVRQRLARARTQPPAGPAAAPA